MEDAVTVIQPKVILVFLGLVQTEIYPALILFPAEKKNAIPYEGDMGVADVIKFIADHGSNSHHLIHEKGNSIDIGYFRSQCKW